MADSRLVLYDTTLAVTRMIFDGFIDHYPNPKLIAAHGCGAIPYLSARLDIFHQLSAACREEISAPLAPTCGASTTTPPSTW